MAEDPGLQEAPASWSGQLKLEAMPGPPHAESFWLNNWASKGVWCAALITPHCLWRLHPT